MKKTLLLCIIPFGLHAQSDSTWKKTPKFQYFQFNMIKEQWDSISSVLKLGFDNIPHAGAAFQIMNNSGRIVTIYDSVRVPIEKVDTTSKSKKK